MDQIPPVIGSKDRPKPAYGDVGALMGPEDPRGQSCSRRTRRTMTLNAFAGVVWALCFLAAAIAEEKIFTTAANGAPETPKTLAQEIAEVEAQIDAIQETAIAGIPSLLPGSPQRLQALGKLLFFDKELSVNRNEACAFCHMPQTGYQGAFESLNVSSVAMPGSVRTRFALRKPPSAAYAAFSAPLYFAEKPGEGKCSQCFIGGNFWDLRATGLRLHSPTAMQAHGSPLNPLEMANPDPACVVHRISQRPYRALFGAYGGRGRLPWRGRIISMRSAANPTTVPRPRSAPRSPARIPCLWSLHWGRWTGKGFNRPSIKWENRSQHSRPRPKSAHSPRNSMPSWQETPLSRQRNVAAMTCSTARPSAQTATSLTGRGRCLPTTRRRISACRAIRL